MPPQTPRSPAPPTGPGTATGGRHRRADEAPGPLLTRPATGGSPRSARHRAAAYPGGVARIPDGSGRGNRPRHARHAKAPLTERNQSGAHRAPGTVPVEAWLRTARNRPQILLGSLVAAGLLLTAVPIPQGEQTTSVMTAAAQAVAARMTTTDAAPRTKPTREAQDDAPVAAAKPEATETSALPIPDITRARPSATVVRPAAVTVPKGDGPFNSLRTTGSRVVTLSFDDGPDPVQTPRILALLSKYRVKAVFCLVGSQARKHPDLVRQIVDAGHVLCNHTSDHDLKIGKKKPEEIKADLDATDAAIRAAVPGVPIPYFRAPGGNFTERLVSVAYAGGMTSLYWEVDPRDWQHPAGESAEKHVQRVVAEVKQKTRPGAIVLSHDFNQPQTVTAYEELLPWLTSNFQVGLPGDTGVAPEPSAPATTAPAPSPSASPSATATPSAPAGSPSASATPSATP